MEVVLSEDTLGCIEEEVGLISQSFLKYLFLLTISLH